MPLEHLVYIGENNAHQKFKSQLVNEKIFFMMIHIDQQDLLAKFQAFINHPSHQNEQGSAIVGITTKPAVEGEQVEGIFVSQDEANLIQKDPDLFFVQVWRKMFVECQRIFETYLIELYLEICRKDPRQMKSERNVTMADVLQGMESDSLLEVLTEKIATVFSHFKFKDVCKEYDGLGLPIIPTSWDSTTPIEAQLREGLQRQLSFLWAARNIIQHNDGKVNEMFLQGYPKSGMQIGQVVDINPHVLSETVNLVEVLAYDLNRRAVEKFGI